MTNPQAYGIIRVQKGKELIKMTEYELLIDIFRELAKMNTTLEAILRDLRTR